MQPELPIYTASRLYVVEVLPFERVFIPAGHEPRYVVGVRTYCSEELAADPEDANVVPAIQSRTRGFLSLIDDVTRDVVIANVPLNRCCQSLIIGQSKAAGNPASSFGFGPIVFPFEPPGLIDLAGSWVYGAEPSPRIVGIEFFFNDLWLP